jgi:signal transduction histidine kinase
VSLRSAQPVPALGLGFDGTVAARPLFGTRLSAGTAQRAVAIAIVPVALTVWLALSSKHLEKPLASALYWGFLTGASMAIGLYWWVRRPASRFGPLLVIYGALVWIVSWQGADWPLPFDIGVLAEGPFFWLTFYLFLAFPMGRLEPTASRWLMAALGLGVLTLFLPWALLSPVIAGGGPLSRCAPSCPANVLQIGNAPGVVDVVGRWETYVELTIIVGVFVVYLVRVRTASRPQRRALMAVAVTSLLFLPARFAVSFSSSILHLSPGTLDTLGWAIVATRILMPLGFLIALLQAQRFAERTSHSLVGKLAAGPTPEQWSTTIAASLDDPSLRLGFYDPPTRRHREPSGEILEHPRSGSGQSWVPIKRGGRPAAAMVVDETLAENPELLRAAASTTLLAVERGDLERELRESRARILQAGDSERRRIEQDLHDGAQQCLLALRTHLALASEDSDDTEKRAELERLGAEVDAAIEELRTLAHGIYPHVLADGVGPALSAVATRAAIPVDVDNEWSERPSEAVETAVYFSCLECLQNAAKHAGPGASVTIRLTRADGSVGFRVEDDGAGFDPAAVTPGRGLANVADRVAAVGGTIDVDARPGAGTRISAAIPRSAARGSFIPSG